jgi:hypothetical protein
MLVLEDEFAGSADESLSIAVETKGSGTAD